MISVGVKKKLNWFDLVKGGYVIDERSPVTRENSNQIKWGLNDLVWSKGRSVY